VLGGGGGGGKRGRALSAVEQVERVVDRWKARRGLRWVRHREGAGSGVGVKCGILGAKIESGDLTRTPHLLASLWTSSSRRTPRPGGVGAAG
jgi:hypothetical protein